MQAIGKSDAMRLPHVLTREQPEVNDRATRRNLSAASLFKLSIGEKS
jgi:hypothetical protein